MRTRTAVVAVALLIGAVAAIPVAGMAATDGPVADQHENGTENADENASVAPGERLSGVVGVQEAELEGEVDERTFGIKVAQAASNESRADVVAEQLGDVEQRLTDLEERKQELDEAHENGSMSEGKYRAEVAELAAQTQTAKGLANSSENASQGLPAELLESKGINVEAIQTLKNRAGQLTGPEVAEIARSIAGDAAPTDAGPPEDRPSETGSSDSDGDAGPPEDRPGDGDATDDSDDGEDEQTPTPTDVGDETDSDTDGEDNPGGSGSAGGNGGSGGSY